MKALAKILTGASKHPDGDVTVSDQATVRKRIAISMAIGTTNGVLCWRILAHLNLGAGDFAWAIRAATYLVHGQNPYNTPLEQYPMTAALLALPFLRFPGEIAGGIFYGLSSALLSFGLTRNGYSGLIVFLAYPYWAGMLVAQWSPLILAAAFCPLLLPATMAKPQIGLPVALSHLSRPGILLCLAVLLISLLLSPRWPILWFHQWGNYQHFVPIFIFPGFLLLLALLRWRRKDSQVLLLAALMPQRYFFDAFILWAIPKSRREILWTAVLSWVPGIWRWNYIPHSSTEIGRWAVIFFYMPMLVIILARYVKEERAANRDPVDVEEK